MNTLEFEITPMVGLDCWVATVFEKNRVRSIYTGTSESQVRDQVRREYGDIFESVPSEWAAARRNVA